MMSVDYSSRSEPAPKNWVVNITKLLKEKDAVETPVCILKARKMLRDIKPEDYTPQLIGLGPYHHWRHDLYEMELYKLISAKKAAEKAALNEQQAVSILEGLVGRLMGETIAQIRACYDRNLDVHDHELAWMMVIDAIFLLQFLEAFVHEQGSYLSKHKRMSYLVDPTQTAYHSILKDMMKLENQIPTIVLEDMNLALNIIQEDYSLIQLLIAACKKLSPLKPYETNYLKINHKAYHLLDLLYYFIVPPQLPQLMQEDCPPPVYKQGTSKDASATNLGQENGCQNCLSTVSLPNVLGQMLGNLNLQHAPMRFLRFVGELKQTLFPTVMLSRKENTSSGGRSTGAPTVEEIEIPSASDLFAAGVKFCPADGPITSCISFDKRTRKFHLPIIYIDGNTEVIIRNLVAYEGAAIPGSLVLARYTELMNGIIDTPEDVRLLRERKIIVSYLKRDEDVANMWNLMSRSIRLSHVPSIDKVIKEINEYYATNKWVRFNRFKKDCMFCTRKVLMLLFAVLLLVLLFIQSYCNVYKCSRVIAAVGES